MMMENFGKLVTVKIKNKRFPLSHFIIIAVSGNEQPSIFDKSTY